VNNTTNSRNDIRFVDIAFAGEAATAIVGDCIHRY
jgi:hypothetical protein